MNNMTVLELLKKKLPQGYVLAIIENMEEKIILDHEVEGSILDELETIFDWTNSKEGYHFWAHVYDAMASGEALPKLPLTVAWKPNTYICTKHESYIINTQGSGQDILIRTDFSDKPNTLEGWFWKETHLAFCN
tara:strand:+ start:539 stop:940 length:402 start_codon:yes stop_codon:yes gene_type:complete